MVEEGLQGSKFPATIVEVGAATVLVQHTTLSQEGEASEEPMPLRESYPRSLLSPPPPPPPAGWPHALQAGGVAEMEHEGGWWTVDVLQRQAAKGGGDKAFKFLVAATGFDVPPRWATSKQLRPSSNPTAAAASV